MWILNMYCNVIGHCWRILIGVWIIKLLLILSLKASTSAGIYPSTLTNVRFVEED